MPDTTNTPAEAPMRIHFDTEFIEDGHTIDLLSIGMVREDGETYYAEVAETDRNRASDWVRDNVIRHLAGPVKPRTVIAAEIRDFAGNGPEFWAWYADYDWVALCQLYGTMMDLPDGWPMFCRDLRQHVTSDDLVPQDGSDGPEHHALSDARWLARAHAALTSRSLVVTGPTRTPAGLAGHLAPLGDDLMSGTCESGRIFRKRVPDQYWSEITDDLGPVAYVEGDDETAPVVAEYLADLVNAHRAGRLFTLDAALDWVAEQLADPEVVEPMADAFDDIDVARDALSRVLAALRDRASAAEGYA